MSEKLNIRGIGTPLVEGGPPWVFGGVIPIGPVGHITKEAPTEAGALDRFEHDA